MTEEILDWFKIDRILDYVISLYSKEEEDQSTMSAHSHTESKIDKAFRLIDTYGIPYERGEEDK